MFFWQNSMLHAGKGNLTSPEIVNTMKQSRKHNLAGGKKNQLQYPMVFSHESEQIPSIFPIHQIPSVFSMYFPCFFPWFSSYLQPHPA